MTVRIFNAAGAEIGVDADGTYPLTPGDSSYTYIATKNEYYHAKGIFAAPKEGDTSLTITAVTPETDDYLTSLKLAASAVGTSSVYLPAEQFRAGTHVYASQMDDRNNSVYVWAVAVQDKGCKIRVPRTDGKDTNVPSRDNLRHIRVQSGKDGAGSLPLHPPRLPGGQREEGHL